MPSFQEMNVSIEYTSRFNELSTDDKVAIIELINTLASHKTSRGSYTDIIIKAKKNVWNRFVTLPTVITDDTIVTGIMCKACDNELPPMTAKQHLDGQFNQTCPHK